MVDPGFPIGGGANLVGGGAPTPDAATFCKIFMSKRKNLDHWGGGRRRRPPGSANGIHQQKISHMYVI